MISVKNDCYGCEERHLNCHDDCPKYADFKKRLEALRREERKREMADAMFITRRRKQ